MADNTKKKKIIAAAVTAAALAGGVGGYYLLKASKPAISCPTGQCSHGFKIGGACYYYCGGCPASACQ